MFGFSTWLVSLFRKFSLFAVYPPPCHSVRSRGRSRRIHHPSNYPRPLGEGGPSQTVGEGQTKALSPNSQSTRREPSPKKKFFFLFLKVWILQLRASLTCRMTWEWGGRMGEKTKSLKDASTNGTRSVPRFFSTILILTAWWNHWNAVYQKRILPPTSPSPWGNTLKIPLIKPLSIGTMRSQQTDWSILALDG